MKKNSVYLGIALVIGIVVGYFIFNNDGQHSVAGSKDTNEHQHLTQENEQLWTCSMHPQILQQEAGDCPICGMELIPAEFSDSDLDINEIKMTQNAMALANIQTIIVGSTIANSKGLTLSGKIVENEKQTATQPAHFNGRIEKLYVNSKGEQVRMGQAVAKIYSPDLVAAQQELITAYKLKESQPQLYSAVRNKFKNWKIHDNQLSIIEQTGEVKTSFTIYSHVSGFISEIMVDEGDHIMDGHPIFKVANLSNVWAEFDAYESQLSQLSTGDKITVVANALPNQEFFATISFIDPILNTQTRTVTIRAELPNNQGQFKPGMFVQGVLQQGVTTGIEQIAVPASSVMWTGERSLVYLKTSPNTPVFKMQEVSLGQRIEDSYIVISGLDNGDEIVTHGAFTVDAAAQLQGKASMMNQPKKANKIKTDLHLSKELQTDIIKSLKPYFDLKNAFIDGDVDRVSAFAKALQEQFSTLKKEKMSTTLQQHFNKTDELLTSIHSNNDIEGQRAQFVALNEYLIAVIKNISQLEEVIYVQKCPMANNNKGATWLSEEKTIRNPYYGEQMLGCGEVIERLQ